MLAVGVKNGASRAKDPGFRVLETELPVSHLSCSNFYRKLAPGACSACWNRWGCGGLLGANHPSRISKRVRPPKTSSSTFPYHTAWALPLHLYFGDHFLMKDVASRGNMHRGVNCRRDREAARPRDQCHAPQGLFSPWAVSLASKRHLACADRIGITSSCLFLITDYHLHCHG